MTNTTKQTDLPMLPDDNVLGTTGGEINRLHADLVATAKTSITFAIRIGGLLSEQKSKLGHGGWLAWLRAHIHFSERTARNYLMVWNRREEIERESVTDLTEAYRLLSPPEAPSRSAIVADLPPGPVALPPQEGVEIISPGREPNRFKPHRNEPVNKPIIEVGEPHKRWRRPDPNPDAPLQCFLRAGFAERWQNASFEQREDFLAYLRGL